MEKAKQHPDVGTSSRLKGVIQKELGNLYAHAESSASYEKALQCLESAKTTFHDWGDFENLLDTQLDTADVLRQMRHFDEAEQLLRMLQNIFDLRGDETFASQSLTPIHLKK